MPCTTLFVAYGKLASECNSFAEYVDYKNIAVSSVTTMVFAPISIGGNCVVNSAFTGCGVTGATGFAGQLIANFAVVGNISMLEAIVDLFEEMIM